VVVFGVRNLQYGILAISVYKLQPSTVLCLEGRLMMLLRVYD
jgi:hypothetical protein